MSYELVAYLVPLAALDAAEHRFARAFAYPLTDTLGLVPLCGTMDLPMGWPVQVSRRTAVAQISADYFGGVGSQSATVWVDGEIIAENVDVNTALRALGVSRTDSNDEWDTVGLGRFRTTETWAAEVTRTNRQRAEDPLPEILAALQFSSPNQKLQEKVRAGAAADLGERGEEAAIPLLLAAVKATGEEGLRIAAAAALARIGGQGLAVLAEQLREKEPPVCSRFDLLISRLRIFATSVLVTLRRRPPEALAERRKNETDRLNAKQNASRFFAVIHALGEAGPAAGPYTDELAGMLGHWSAGTRSDAAQALARIGPPSAKAVPALIETLRDEESFVRSYAADALGSIGAAAAPALPALGLCLSDDVDYVRKSAEAAIAAIGDSPQRL